MKLKFRSWLHWLSQRPIAIINLLGIILIIGGIVGFFIFQATRPLDVLSDWTIHTSSARQTRAVDGVTVSVYNPGDSLVFTSKSTKLTEAIGTTTRTIVCEATENQSEREIQLDTIPATRPVGVSPKRENAIVIPDVSQFAKLPRWCKLVIDISYNNVLGTGRTHTEHAESDKFLVEEAELDAANLRQQIKDLTQRLDQLETQKSSPSRNTDTGVVTPNNSTTNNSTTNNTTNNNTSNTTTTPDDGFQLHDVPLVGGLFKGIGL